MNLHVRTFLFTLLLVGFHESLQAQDSLRLEERVPVVTGISPESGPIGTIVSIKGKNFSSVPAENLVRMGSILCPVITATDTVLTIKIPVGMNSQRLTVTNQYGLITITEFLFKVTFESLGAALGRRSLRVVKNYSRVIGRPFSVTTADLDNNGELEFIVTDGFNTATIFQKNQHLPFDYTNDNKFGRLDGIQTTVQDLNGDEVPEIIYGSSDLVLNIIIP